MSAPCEVFASARASFEDLVVWLESNESALLTHGELEDQIDRRGREMMRQMFQAQLELRALREQRLGEVVCAEGVTHRAVEPGHSRKLATIFGAVEVQRLAYRRRGHPNCYVTDAQLNLPTELHSHGLRRLAAIESSRGSFAEATQAIQRATDQRVGKRQVESLTTDAAFDVEDFYATRTHPPANRNDVLVISADGKGIVMRPEALRPPTAAKARNANHKLTGRLSKGEKRNRKRLAEVGAVYDITPAPRTPADIMAPNDTNTAPANAPVATAKWLTASVVDNAADVLATVFDEAERRDPNHTRTWIALVDGNNHQIDCITTQAAARNINITIVIDFIHVIEYLWDAAWCFHPEGDPAAQTWVRERALKILHGQARHVAAGIRRRATTTKLHKTKRRKADICARYLNNKAPYLDYPTALTAGWPIATGIIEGACRHLVKDRMDITGARWGLDGAEAVLKLRAIRANGDFDDYWTFHLNNEQHRNHHTRYTNTTIPTAA
jgi:hypothetical protein